jgi:hypothetical protein
MRSDYAPKLSILTRTLDTIGADLPKPLAKAIKDRDTITQATAALSEPSPEQLASAVATAILDGRDPLEDAEVRRLTTARTLSGTGALDYGLTQEANSRIVEALQASADDVLAILKAAADDAGETLTRAHATIGDHDLTQADQILAKGPAAATAWAEAKGAVQTIRSADTAWTMLADLARFADSSLAPALRLAALDLDTFEKVGRTADAWTIVRAGATIDLATKDTARERAQGYAEAITARQNNYDRAFSREWKRENGI